MINGFWATKYLGVDERTSVAKQLRNWSSRSRIARFCLLGNEMSELLLSNSCEIFIFQEVIIHPGIVTDSILFRNSFSIILSLIRVSSHGVPGYPDYTIIILI